MKRWKGKPGWKAESSKAKQYLDEDKPKKKRERERAEHQDGGFDSEIMAE